MSEREDDQTPAESGAVPAEPVRRPAVEPARPASGSPPESPRESPRESPPGSSRGSTRAALWLAGLLTLILAGIALSPFWAPQIAPLLPWGDNRGEYAALEARLAAFEARPVPPAKAIDSIQSAASALAHRVDQLETVLTTQQAEIEKRPATPSIDLEPIGSALSALTRRVDHLEAAAKPDSQVEGAVAAIRAELQQLQQRLAAIETQSASRVATEAAAAKDTEQQFAKLGKTDTDLAERVAALEREAQSQNATQLRTDGTLALLLAQMREAIEQARPFPTEFNAFEKLAQDPDIAAAARPLADAARNGVASRAVLEKQLAELARGVAPTSEPEGDGDWGAQTLARLRGLVTIRRIDSLPQTGPEAAVSTAQAALARGDVAGAVATLEPLTGANAEAAGPWLRMARERLAAETALDHVQELLTARLGKPPIAPGTTPAKAPVEPEKARTRS